MLCLFETWWSQASASQKLLLAAESLPAIVYQVTIIFNYGPSMGLLSSGSSRRYLQSRHVLLHGVADRLTLPAHQCTVVASKQLEPLAPVASLLGCRCSAPSFLATPRLHVYAASVSGSHLPTPVSCLAASSVSLPPDCFHLFCLSRRPSVSRHSFNKF